MENVPYNLDSLKISGVLHKSWIGSNIAKEKIEWDKIEVYAKRINKWQREN